MLMGIIYGLLELSVRLELLPAPEAHFIRMGGGIFLDLGGRIFRPSAPPGSLAGLVFITKAAEDSIWQEPGLFRLHEGLVGVGGEESLDLFRPVSLAQQVSLGLVDPLVILLRKGVQFVSHSLIAGVRAAACRREIDELRMKGEDGVRVVRI